MNEDPISVLPCGCTIQRIEATREFRLVACKPTCTYVQFVLQEADRQGKPAEVRNQ